MPRSGPGRRAGRGRRSRVNGYDAVRLLRARARQLAHDQAGLLADMAEVAHCAPGRPHAPPRRIPVTAAGRSRRRLEIFVA